MANKSAKGFKKGIAATLAICALFLLFATRSYFAKKEMIRLRRAIKPIVVRNLDPITKQVISIDYVERSEGTIYVYLKYKINSEQVRYSIDIKQSVIKRLVPEIEKWCRDHSDYHDQDVEVRFSDDFTKKSS